MAFALLVQIKFVLLLSRQGKVRLSKWYTTMTQKDRAKIIREITPMVLARPLKLCNFLDWKDNKVTACSQNYARWFTVCSILPQGSNRRESGLRRSVHYAQLLSCALVTDTSHIAQPLLCDPNALYCT